MQSELDALNREIFITLADTTLGNVLGRNNHRIMNPELFGLLPFVGTRTFSGAPVSFFVPGLLFKFGRFDLRFRLLTLQPGYLVSQFLNLLLLDTDNLQQSDHQGGPLFFGNMGYFRYRAHRPYRAYFPVLVA